MLFQTSEAYSNTDQTNVTYNNNQMSMVKKGVRQLAYEVKRSEWYRKIYNQHDN
jgi:hypothetical protein